MIDRKNVKYGTGGGDDKTELVNQRGCMIIQSFCVRTSLQCFVTQNEKNIT